MSAWLLLDDRLGDSLYSALLICLSCLNGRTWMTFTKPRGATQNRMLPISPLLAVYRYCRTFSVTLKVTLWFLVQLIPHRIARDKWREKHRSWEQRETWLNLLFYHRLPFTVFDCRWNCWFLWCREARPGWGKSLHLSCFSSDLHSVWVMLSCPIW